jgi:hypothetical protein
MTRLLVWLRARLMPDPMAPYRRAYWESGR